jgi:hypothetical protein
MKPRVRIGGTLKWGSAVVTVLLVVLWIVTGWWALQFATADGYGGGVGAGRIVLGKSSPRSESVYGAYEVPVTGLNRLGLGRDGIWRLVWLSDSEQTALYVPLWCPIAILLVVTGAAWRLDRSAHNVARAGAPLHSKPDSPPGVDAFIAVAVVVCIVILTWTLRR